ncbi:MAG: hypothetical protein WBE08_14445 [Methyloceanibacter sp.]
MVCKKLLVAGATLCAVVAFVAVSQPVYAGSCAVATAKSRGLLKASVDQQAARKLNRNVNRWAKKNHLKAVRVGQAATSCNKGVALSACTTSVKVCS